LLKGSAAIGLDAIKRQNLINEILKNTPGVTAGAVYQSGKVNQENQ